MATRTAAVCFLLLNLFFFTIVGPIYVPCPPTPKTPSSSGHGHGHGHNPAKAKCPKDTLKFGVCAKLLNDLARIIVGTPAKTPCCSLIDGLSDVEAAVCLCTAVKANVMGIKLNVPVSVSLVLNNCGKKVPSGYECA